MPRLTSLSRTTIHSTLRASFVRWLVAFAALVACHLVSSRALAIVIPGGNVINQTWTPANNPYIVQGDVTVPAGAYLNIQAGTIVQFASSDGQAAGLDASRIELVVKGTLSVTGTQASPVTFAAQAGSGSSVWYGIVADTTATSVSIDNATIAHAARAVRSDVAGSVLTVSNVSIDSSAYGFLLNAGSPTLSKVTVVGGSYGLYATGAAAPVVTGSRFASASTAAAYLVPSTGSPTLSFSTTQFVGSGSYGVYFVTSGSALATLSLSNDTVHANGSYGVYVYAGSGSTATANIENTNVTQQSYGVYRDNGPGTETTVVTYSNVWGNSSNNYVGAVAGVGCISGNPLYVNAPANLRLTSNSPSRFAGDDGLDLGPLPYVNDATPGYHGTLWTNTVLTLAGSPYTMLGDVTVAPGVTLTIQPGVVVSFTSSDLMASGVDTSRAELAVSGTLIAQGTEASPITLQSNNPVSSAWFGVNVAPNATSALLEHVILRHAARALRSEAPGAQLSATDVSIETSAYGVFLTAGTPTLTSVHSVGGSYGLYTTGSAAPQVHRSSFRSASTAGVYLVPSTGSPTISLVNTVVASSGSYGVYFVTSGSALANLSLVNDTVHANGSYGVYIYAGSGSSATATITNSLVTQQSYGVYRDNGPGTETTTVTYSDVWGNSSNNYVGAVAGVGCISQNPQYVSPPSNLALQSSSVCVDVGTSVGAPSVDLEGKPRPLDGDGINGAAHDMGAYELAPVTFCGDGTVNGTELCDDGAQNGQYGFCKADCSGPGPFCGDGLAHPTEQCDDGNALNSDACLTTCLLATCGDGYVRAGFELCDDGNLIDTDACRATCVPATCGDGVTWAGMEACDDGNASNTDACLTTCVAASCGDGFVQQGVEQCDDQNGSNTDGCLTTCVAASCGDGFVQQGVEQCDDQNGSNTDGCLTTCVAASCGDGFVQQGVEQCDDGNQVNGDACTNACAPASCGDGVVQQGVEECDDGNLSNTDSCVTGCKQATCGDGFVQANVEGCDDGNMNDADGCSNQCKLPGCGDGIVQANEQCDDGNASNTDGCLVTCFSASCGDGFVQAGVEECDDGNQDDTDACTTACEPAACGDGFVEDGVEECDDGNDVDTDDCPSTCERPPAATASCRPASSSATTATTSTTTRAPTAASRRPAATASCRRGKSATTATPATTTRAW
jgi:cysteine-rich repeat protein